MNRIAIVVAALVIGLVLSRYRDRGTVIDSTTVAPSHRLAEPVRTELASSGFSCDSRKRCEQMRSCGEAKYFLAHCPGVQMDGDNDGIPCEGQWCGN